MLARANRLTASADFTETLRKGRRANVGALTGFLLTSQTTSESESAEQPPRFGFQVSRRVGGSVDRHRVVRQLRHLIAPWVAKTPNSAMVVIRPDRKCSDYHEDVDLLMRRLTESGSKR
jgi:ribonuclease P protein component